LSEDEFKALVNANKASAQDLELMVTPIPDFAAWQAASQEAGYGEQCADTNGLAASDGNETHCPYCCSVSHDAADCPTQHVGAAPISASVFHLTQDGLFCDGKRIDAPIEGRLRAARTVRRDQANTVLTERLLATEAKLAAAMIDMGALQSRTATAEQATRDIMVETQRLSDLCTSQAAELAQLRPLVPEPQVAEPRGNPFAHGWATNWKIR
jgi:hypothetical protein